MIASITRVQSPLIFLLNQVLICYTAQKMEQMMERLLAEMKVGNKEMMAEMRAWQREIKARREATEAYPE
jgi:hypothetical protein